MSPAPPSRLPSGSVVIPTRNRPELLRDTVRSILQGEVLPAELIVVDQSDQPDAALPTAPGRCEVRYLWSSARGASRARNDGITAARHDLLVFTDDDVLVEPTWYARIVEALLRAGPRTVVTGRVLPARPEMARGFAPSINPATEPAVWEGRIGRDVLFSNNMAFHRAAVQAVGDFDERLGAPWPGGEDNDLGHRLLEAGYRIVFTPEAVVYHRAWRPWEEYTRLRYRYGRGQGAFYAKHLDLRDRYILRRLASDTAGRLWRLPGRVWREKKNPMGELCYVWGVLSGMARWWRNGAGRQ